MAPITAGGRQSDGGETNTILHDMDAEFERRWRGGMAPFDGMTLRAKDDGLPLSALRRALLAALAPRSTLPLWMLHDWHQHDGYVSSAVRTSWHDLRAMVASEDALYAARSGDTGVCKAFFPENRSFYLRFDPNDDVDAEAYAGRSGTFDVTCAPSLAETIAHGLHAVGIGDFVVEPAQAFFNRVYGG